MMPIIWLKIWNASFQRSTSSKLSSTQLLDKTQNRRNIWELLKTSSRWLVPLHPSVTPFQVDSAWLSASLSSSNLMMYWFILSLSGHTLSMMMISTGTSVLPQLPQKNSRKQKKPCFKSKMRSISKTTATFHGYADATSWTSSLISPGTSTSTWRPPTNRSPSWT